MSVLAEIEFRIRAFFLRRALRKLDKLRREIFDV